jgi:hypothetical protein
MSPDGFPYGFSSRQALDFLYGMFAPEAFPESWWEGSNRRAR